MPAGPSTTTSRPAPASAASRTASRRRSWASRSTSGACGPMRGRLLISERPLSGRRCGSPRMGASFARRSVATMNRPAPLRALAAAVVLVAASACTSTVAPADATEPTPTANPAGGGIAPGTLFTPLAAGTYTTPAPVRGTDGRTHLAYELTLTNALPLPYQLQRVDVRDGATHAVIQSVSGATLAAD